MSQSRDVIPLLIY